MTRAFTFTVLMLALFCGVALADTSVNPLDGKTFIGTMGKTGDMKGDADNFIFKNGTFHSTACDKYGYTSAPFTTMSGPQTTFRSTTQNDKGAKMNWNGTLTGNLIQGSAVMTTADGKTGDTFWFKGSIGTSTPETSKN